MFIFRIATVNKLPFSLVNLLLFESIYTFSSQRHVFMDCHEAKPLAMTYFYSVRKIAVQDDRKLLFFLAMTVEKKVVIMSGFA